MRYKKRLYVMQRVLIAHYSSHALPISFLSPRVCIVENLYLNLYRARTPRVLPPLPSEINSSCKQQCINRAYLLMRPEITQELRRHNSSRGVICEVSNAR